jgi:hypothetical protein
MELTWSAFGQKVYQGAALPVIYPGIAGRVDLERIRKLLFAARKTTSLQELETRLVDRNQCTPEAARFLVLWAIKQDLLERAT